MEIHGETGKPWGRTQFSEYAERFYEKHREDRGTLSATEYAALVNGLLREFACIAECSLFIAAARDIEVKQAIRTYLKDVCHPNYLELKSILQKGGYKAPVKEAELKDQDEIKDVATDIIDDRSIVLNCLFLAKSKMQFWNECAMLCQRTDVRDACLRNYHRENRWVIAFYDHCVEKGYILPLPNMDVAGLFRAAIGG